MTRSATLAVAALGLLLSGAVASAASLGCEPGGRGMQAAGGLEPCSEGAPAQSRTVADSGDGRGGAIAPEPGMAVASSAPLPSPRPRRVAVPLPARAPFAVPRRTVVVAAPASFIPVAERPLPASPRGCGNLLCPQYMVIGY
ncbi:hypothetical protein ACI7BZ_06180 [Xanthobacter sp. AM11]|uniref:hypothetical protein n=1 Tax=Xanthobacter sp. AM11 TaxID=3380643 RepID=UPI0039BF5B91